MVYAENHVGDNFQKKHVFDKPFVPRTKKKNGYRKNEGIVIFKAANARAKRAIKWFLSAQVLFVKKSIFPVQADDSAWDSTTPFET